MFDVSPATEIQNLQIGDGDVAQNIPIPIYMVFPRLFTCPTLMTTNFKIGKLVCLRGKPLGHYGIQTLGINEHFNKNWKIIKYFFLHISIQI